MNFISNLLVCSLGCFIFHILPDRVSADPLSPAPTSLSLKAAIEDTLKNNVGIAVQKYNSKINEQSIFEKEADFDTTLDFEFSAGEETRQAAGAFANPVKSRNQNYDWDFSISKKFMTGADYELSLDSNRNLTNSTFAGLNPQYTSDLNLSFTQPLLKDFGIDNNKREIYIAKNNQKISDFEFKASVIDVITEAENTYWDLVFSIEDLKVKKKSLERAQDLEKQVKAQVEVGTMAPLEMLQAQSEVASRDQLLLSAQDLIQDNEDNLKNILNYSFDSEQGRSSLNPSEPPVFDPGTEGTLEEAIQIALNDRPDLLVKKKELEEYIEFTKARKQQGNPVAERESIQLRIDEVGDDHLPVRPDSLPSDIHKVRVALVQGPHRHHDRALACPLGPGLQFLARRENRCHAPSPSDASSASTSRMRRICSSSSRPAAWARRAVAVARTR